MDFNLKAASFTDVKNFNELKTDILYDTVIIGGGPAGLTAAVYCMRKGLKTAIVLKNIGGQVAETAGVENYLGYKYIDGTELANKFKEQVLQFGIDYSEGVGVTSIENQNEKIIKLEDGRELKTRTVIIATGKTWRKLGVPGEKEFQGKGVAYCSICDGPLFKNKTVAVVGGGNSGVEALIDLASIAQKVYLIQFLDKLTADDILIESLSNFDNIEYLYNSEVKQINGSVSVHSLVIEDRDSKEKKTINVNGVFIEIGMIPNSSFVDSAVKLAENGEIPVNSKCETETEGIFAAGDVTTVPFKQIIIAGGEGAKAALSAYEYIVVTSINYNY